MGPEGLKFTPKGCKDLAGGRRLKLIVAIAYGKGMVLKEAYEKWMGGFFHSLIGKILTSRLGQKEMGNDFSWWTMIPVNGATSQRVLENIEAELHEIPARSPHINFIESIFHLLRMDLEGEAIFENVTSETFEQFRDLVFRSLERLPVDLIDRTIESMNNTADWCHNLFQRLPNPVLENCV